MWLSQMARPKGGGGENIYCIGDEDWNGVESRRGGKWVGVFFSKITRQDLLGVMMRKPFRGSQARIALMVILGIV